MIGMLDINDGSSGRELSKTNDTIFLYASIIVPEGGKMVLYFNLSTDRHPRAQMVAAI